MAWDPVLAVEFLTGVRLRAWRPVDVDDLARAQAFYPLVGLGLGGVLVLLDWGLSRLLPPAPRAAVLVTALAAGTRGLHLDGLADTFDGLLGGSTAERRLEIMRDPTLGSFGAAALVLTLLLKWSALASLGGDWRRGGMLLFPALGRLAIVVAVAAVPYARASGLGTGFHAAARGAPLVLATAAAAAICVVVFGIGGLTLLAVAVGVALAVAGWAFARIGGVTGDVYGAACELAEVAVLLVLIGLGENGWLRPWLVGG